MQRRDAACFYPQSHLKFDGGAGPRILEGKTLIQCHVLLHQQATQRHRQVTQSAFVLVVFYLCKKQRSPFRNVSYLICVSVRSYKENRCCP